MPSIDLKDQYFGCEIEMTGLTRQQAAEAVASLFGTNAVHSRSSRTYDPWEATDNEGKTWRFVYDSSIHGSHRTGRQQVPIGDGDYKVEMNSPKLEYSEMGKLQEVVRTLRHAGAVVNGSCGMHVHVDASKHIKISHNDTFDTLYAHCSSICVTVGQEVKQGEVIGYVGTTGNSTGNHLHFEVWQNGERTDALRHFKNKNKI